MEAYGKQLWQKEKIDSKFRYRRHNRDQSDGGSPRFALECSGTMGDRPKYPARCSVEKFVFALVRNGTHECVRYKAKLEMC